MLILGFIALLARICYPMTKFLAKFRLFYQSFTLLRGQNLIFRLFTSKTLFVLQNPSFWCATWVYCISFNIFIKKGAGVYIDPLKKRVASQIWVLPSFIPCSLYPKSHSCQIWCLLHDLQVLAILWSIACQVFRITQGGGGGGKYSFHTIDFVFRFFFVWRLTVAHYFSNQRTSKLVPYLQYRIF